MGGFNVESGDMKRGARNRVVISRLSLRFDYIFLAI
jgi:hypothetical protein